MRVTNALVRAARLRPDAIATIEAGEQATWRETADRVARLAGAIAARGGAPGSRVAVLANNGAA